VPRENILQLLPDAVVPGKEELAAYWRMVATRALPLLANRPLKLVRHSRGTTFYHKGRLPPLPESVHQLRIEKREGVRLWVDDLAGLLGLVEIGVVELHPWAATVDDYEHADHLVFDLDPGDGVSWDFVIETAFKMRELLEGEGLETWPKTTGGKGLHVMAPLAKRMTHDAAHALAKRLAQRLAATDVRLITVADPAKRGGRIFATGGARRPSARIRRARVLDFRLRRRLRGGRSRTACGPAPIRWSGRLARSGGAECARVR
jgi:bifunctional non-homologous end joining protein LigD